MKASKGSDDPAQTKRPTPFGPKGITMRLTIPIIALTFLGGCGAVTLPAKSLEDNEASIRSAEELGAASVPAARLHLEMAKDQTAAAKRLAADGDDRAVLVLARAQSDAELALSMAREAEVHQDAVRASNDLRDVTRRTDSPTPVKE